MIRYSIFIIIFVFALQIFMGTPVYAQDTTEEIKINNEETKIFKTAEEEITSIAWVTNDNFESPGSPDAIKGGTIKWSIPGYPATLRRYGPNSNTSFNYMLADLCYESLLGQHPITLEWVPGLADKWCIMPDNKTYYYHIDEDAKWADGTSVTTNDVLASYKFMRRKEIKSPFYNEWYASLEEPVILSKSVIKIVTKEDGWRAFQKPSGLTVLPEKYIGGEKVVSYLKDWQFKFMPGSGPYKFESAINGRELIFVKRKDYWGANKKVNEGMYNFDTFRFMVVSDESLMFEMFKKGDLDWYYVNVARRWVNECNFDKVEKGWIQKRKIFIQKPQGVYGIAFNMRKPPFDDIRVRKAFAYMFNRDILIEKLFFNEYLPMQSYFPGGLYENPTNEKVKYNPDKAVALLKEAGYDKWDKQGRLCKDGVPFVVSLMYTSKSSERIWTVVQDYMADIGITLKLKLVTGETQFKLVNDRKFKIVNQAWGGLQDPNPKGSYHSMMADTKSTTNICGVKDPEIDKLIDEYDNCLDPKKRIKLIQRIDKILTEMRPYALAWYGPFNRIMYWNKFGQPDFYLPRFGNYTRMAMYWWIDPAKEEILNAAMKDEKDLPSGETNVYYWKEYSERELKEQEEKEKIPENIKE